MEWTTVVCLLGFVGGSVIAAYLGQSELSYMLAGAAAGSLVPVHRLVPVKKNGEK